MGTSLKRLKQGNCKFGSSVGYISKILFENRTKIISKSKTLYADFKSKKKEDNKILSTGIQK